MSKHDRFILTPITSVIKEAIIASYGIGSGMETYPISEYVIHSLFLKMTGFQEQKLKCITWEMATNDYEYRRCLLGDNDKLGECSSFKSKEAILTRLNEVISNIKPNFDINMLFEEVTKKSIRDDTICEIEKLFKDTNLSIWKEADYRYFVANGEDILSLSQILPKKPDKQKKVKLFQNILEEKYDKLYDQRNKLAHNTVVFQDNLPSLQILQEENRESRNYFVWFSILVLIDKIFIRLYQEYKNIMEEFY